jgi:hypothetical protein
MAQPGNLKPGVQVKGVIRNWIGVIAGGLQGRTG